MFNKDFLKQVLIEEKMLMPISEVRFINVPHYDEGSVKQLWPKMKEATDFMQYFPDKLPQGRLPNREYFFNIMNSICGEYVTQLIKHANAQRNSIAREDQ